MKKNLLVFHPVIAPYRIDLFNALSRLYNTQVCLFWHNLKDQTFDYAKIEKQFDYKPSYIVKEEMGLLKWMKAIWKKLDTSRPDIVLGAEFGISTNIAMWKITAVIMIITGLITAIMLIKDAVRKASPEE